MMEPQSPRPLICPCLCFKRWGSCLQTNLLSLGVCAAVSPGVINLEFVIPYRSIGYISLDLPSLYFAVDLCKSLLGLPVQNCGCSCPLPTCPHHTALSHADPRPQTPPRCCVRVRAPAAGDPCGPWLPPQHDGDCHCCVLQCHWVPPCPWGHIQVPGKTFPVGESLCVPPPPVSINSTLRACWVRDSEVTHKLERIQSRGWTGCPGNWVIVKLKVKPKMCISFSNLSGSWNYIGSHCKSGGTRYIFFTKNQHFKTLVS